MTVGFYWTSGKNALSALTKYILAAAADSGLGGISGVACNGV